jgi:hypothetical protein
MPAGEAGGSFQATLRQTFQQLSGDLMIDGGAAAIQDVKLQGDAIELTAVREAGGRKHTYEFSGRIEGDKIAGRVRTGDDKTFEWLATRSARGQMSIE